MKKYISISVIIGAFAFIQAQVAIDKNYTGNPSVLMEFNDTREAANDGSGGFVDVAGDNRAIILPIVSALDNASAEGTLWFDATDDKIKYKTAGQLPDNTPIPVMVDMTDAGSDEDSPLTLDNTLSEVSTQGVVLGNASSTVGALVLESNTQALVLPVVDSVDALANPSAGSLVYDKTEKAIAVFNGVAWYFWGDY